MGRAPAPRARPSVRPMGGTVQEGEVRQSTYQGGGPSSEGYCPWLGSKSVLKLPMVGQ